MDALLVISNEPALAETLQSELAELRVCGTSIAKAHALMVEEKFLMILADCASEDLSALLSTAKAPVVKLTRPFKLRELLATIREQLRSQNAKEEIDISYGYSLIPGERLLKSHDDQTRIALTEKEVELLRVLLAQEKKPVLRDELLKKVWGYGDDIATNTLETHIYRLRGKLRQASPELDIIASEEGGYTLKRS